MKKNFWQHLALLFLTALAAWVWTQVPLASGYTAQLIAVLAVVYLLARFWQKTGSADNAYVKAKVDSLEGAVLTAVALLVVFSTGGAGSPVFFLIYFLMFGLAFVWDPRLVLIFSILLVSLLLFSPSDISRTQSLINSLSVFFIAPLSWFFGRQLLDNLTAAERIKMYQKKWSEDEKQLEKIEGQVLIWLATRLKPGMVETLDRISLLLADLSRLTPVQKSHLKRIRRLSKKLLTESEKLGKLVASIK